MLQHQDVFKQSCQPQHLSSTDHPHIGDQIKQDEFLLIYWNNIAQRRPFPRSFGPMMETRGMAARRRASFPFLQLPAELRLLVYHFCLIYGFSGINKYFDRYVQDIDHGEGRQGPPPAHKTSPGLLRVNRQIYHESIVILESKPLELTHGLLDCKLSDLMSLSLLRRIQHIIVTDNGHRPLAKKYPNSFDGFRSINREITQALRPIIFENKFRVTRFITHVLKKVELRFTDEDLKWHVDNCWGIAHGCDMEKWVMSIFNDWKQIRGVGHIDIKGYLPTHLKEDLQRLTTSKHLSIFHRLPTAIRRKIYSMAADWNDVSKQLDVINHPHAPPHLAIPERSTPSLFLVCKELTFDAKAEMQKLPLVINCKYKPYKGWNTILDVISPSTLQTVKHLKLVFNHRTWIRSLDKLVDILETNSSLETFEFEFNDESGYRRAQQNKEVYPSENLLILLRPLQYLRALRKVTFTGTLPSSVTKYLTVCMTKRYGTHCVDLVEMMRSRERENSMETFYRLHMSQSNHETRKRSYAAYSADD